LLDNRMKLTSERTLLGFTWCTKAT